MYILLRHVHLDFRGRVPNNRNTSRDESVETADEFVETRVEYIATRKKHKNHVTIIHNIVLSHTTISVDGGHKGTR